MSGKVKGGPSNTSENTSLGKLDTGQFAPTEVLPVPVVHPSVKSLHAAWPFRISPLCTRHIEVAKEVRLTWSGYATRGSRAKSPTCGLTPLGSIVRDPPGAEKAPVRSYVSPTLVVC